MTETVAPFYHDLSEDLMGDYEDTNNLRVEERLSKVIGPIHNPPDRPLRSILTRKPRETSTSNPAPQSSTLTTSTRLLVRQKDISSNSLNIENISSAGSQSISATPLTSGELLSQLGGLNNDQNLVYALHTFVATQDGQVCVLKGDGLLLLDDSNSYWWLVRCFKTSEVGYIPAENIETQTERLARLNKQRNIKLTEPLKRDMTDCTVDDTTSINDGERHHVRPTVEIAIESSARDSIYSENDDDEENSSKSSTQKAPKNAVSFSPNVIVVRHTEEETSEIADDSYSDDESDTELGEEDKVGAKSFVKKLTKWGKKRISGIMSKKRPDSWNESDDESEEEHQPIDLSNSADSEVGRNTRSSFLDIISSKSKKRKAQQVDQEQIDTEKSSLKHSRPSSMSSKSQESIAKDHVEKSSDELNRSQKSSSLRLSIGKRISSTLERISTGPITATYGHSERDNVPDQPLSPTTPTATESLIVLKIFSGNHDFKATYKAVSVTKNTTVGDVIKLALVKFKVRNNNPLPLPSLDNPSSLNTDENRIASTRTSIDENCVDHMTIETAQNAASKVHDNLEEQFYLSVVHGDSKEKRLNPNELVLNVLFKLQSKAALPGVSPNSQKDVMKLMQHVTAGGKLSSIRAPNDSEIKFLLNMKTERDSQFQLGAGTFIRVYYFGDHFNTGTLRSCKTVAITADSTVEEIIAKTIHKLKIAKVAMRLDGYTLWKAKEQLVIVYGMGSIADMTNLQSEDPFAKPLKEIKTVIEPDIELDLRAKMVDILRKEALDEISFVLRSPEDVTAVADDDGDEAVFNEKQPVVKSVSNQLPENTIGDMFLSPEEAKNFPVIKIDELDQDQVALIQITDTSAHVFGAFENTNEENTIRSIDGIHGVQLEEGNAQHPRSGELSPDLALALNIVTSYDYSKIHTPTNAGISQISPFSDIVNAYTLPSGNHTPMPDNSDYKALEETSDAVIMGTFEDSIYNDGVDYLMALLGSPSGSSTPHHKRHSKKNSISKEISQSSSKAHSLSSIPDEISQEEQTVPVMPPMQKRVSFEANSDSMTSTTVDSIQLAKIIEYSVVSNASGSYQDNASSSSIQSRDSSAEKGSRYKGIPQAFGEIRELSYSDLPSKSASIDLLEARKIERYTSHSSLKQHPQSTHSSMQSFHEASNNNSSMASPLLSRLKLNEPYQQLSSSRSLELLTKTSATETSVSKSGRVASLVAKFNDLNCSQSENELVEKSASQNSKTRIDLDESRMSPEKLLKPRSFDEKSPHNALPFIQKNSSVQKSSKAAML